MSARAEALAKRVEDGAAALIAAAEGFTDEQWRTEHAGEQRSVGVLVHHVGSAYALEAGVVQTLGAGGSLPGDVNWDAIDAMNAQHASDHADIDKATAIALVRQNSAVAAAAVRTLTDEQLDRVAPIVLNWNAPLTVQFFVEQHPIAHPWVHLESINEALNRTA